MTFVSRRWLYELQNETRQLDLDLERCPSLQGAGTSNVCLSLHHFVKCAITPFTPTTGVFLACGFCLLCKVGKVHFICN